MEPRPTAPEPGAPVLWDEGEPVNRDFTDPAEAARYDAFHRRFRDPDAEFDRIERFFAPVFGGTLGEFGCGSGQFAARMAPRVRELWIVDLSPAMLRRTRDRLEALPAPRAALQFRLGTFLSYNHDGPPLDAWNCSLALHHLPDAWKFEALRRFASWLRPGGLFALTDLVWPDDGPAAASARWMDWLRERGGPELAADLAPHVRKEYSTLDCIMRLLIGRAGFEILDTATAADSVIRTYFCRRP